jgi:hypothetical protein
MSLLVSYYALVRAHEADKQVDKVVELLEHVVAVEGRVLRVDIEYNPCVLKVMPNEPFWKIVYIYLILVRLSQYFLLITEVFNTEVLTYFYMFCRMGAVEITRERYNM